MEKFNKIKSIATPLDRANVDTDAIIPKQFLKSIKRSGFGPNLFDEWRYLDEGSVGVDNSKRAINPDFVLNKKEYQNSQILLTRENFGCGSSREHAPWALLDFGFKVIIAPSFANIFYNNCFKNGILPISLNNKIVDKLFLFKKEIAIDLAKQIIIADTQYSFTIDKERKRRLLNGLDDIALTLEFEKEIKAFEKQHFNKYPWL